MLAAVLMGLGALERELGSSLSGMKLGVLRSDLNSTLQSLRSLAVSLQPPALRLGLQVALEELGDGARAHGFGKVSVALQGAQNLNPEVETMVYRIVEETLEAVGAARELSVRVGAAGDLVIEVQGARHEIAPEQLTILRARIELIGGNLAATTAELRAIIPLPTSRRGRNHRSPDRQRNTRCRAYPQGPSTPRHDGQPNSPPTNSASTNATSAHTINMGATSGIQESPPDATTKLAGGLSRVQNRAKPANPVRVMPPINGTNPASRAGLRRRSTSGRLAGCSAVPLLVWQWMCMRRGSAVSVAPWSLMTLIVLRVVASQCSHSCGLCGRSSTGKSITLQIAQRPSWARWSRWAVWLTGRALLLSSPGPVLGERGVVRGRSVARRSGVGRCWSRRSGA